MLVPVGVLLLSSSTCIARSKIKSSAEFCAEHDIVWSIRVWHLGPRKSVKSHRLVSPPFLCFFVDTLRARSGACCKLGGPHLVRDTSPVCLREHNRKRLYPCAIPPTGVGRLGWSDRCGAQRVDDVDRVLHRIQANGVPHEQPQNYSQGCSIYAHPFHH